MIDRNHNAVLCECQAKELRADVARLREALEQVLVDINDPDPRTSTLAGYRNALAATENMIQRVLVGGKVCEVWDVRHE